jgi:hypothetical protein
MKIGSKVQCIDSSIKASTFLGIIENFKNWVVKDQIYTIREILNNDDIVQGILLEEITNTPIFIKLLNRIQEPAFKLDRFRELQEDEVMAEELEEVSILEILN